MLGVMSRGVYAKGNGEPSRHFIRYLVKRIRIRRNKGIWRTGPGPRTDDRDSDKG